MTVWLRILLYVVAGWLYGSGYIGDEVKELLTTDPAVAASIEAGISGKYAATPSKDAGGTCASLQPCFIPSGSLWSD